MGESTFDIFVNILSLIFFLNFFTDFEQQICSNISGHHVEYKDHCILICYTM
jgi:hypothetical protein